MKKLTLKLNIQKTKIMASGPITSWQIDEETMEIVTYFILGGAPKPLQMVTAAMRLYRTGNADSWRAQTEPCVHQDPGERRSDPIRD